MNGWTLESYQKTVETVRIELEQFERSHVHESGMKHIGELIAKASEQNDHQSRLRTFVLILAALVRQERAPELPFPQVRKLLNLGFDLLRIQRINPEKSRLAFLYWNLHSIHSQILRRNGEHLRAGWEQSAAIRFAGSVEGMGISTVHFSMANRMLRLGEIRFAIEEFDRAIATTESEELLWRCHLNRLTALRLWGLPEMFHAAYRESARSLHLTEVQKADLEWELMCFNLQQDGNYAQLHSAVRRGNGHFRSGFVVEAVLWAMSIAQTEWLDKLPSLESMRKNRSMPTKELGSFFDTALGLQQALSHEIAVSIRVKSLGELVDRIPALITLDKELLAWVATTRILVRMRSYAPAILCLAQYRAISLRVTEGRSPDCLGIAGDLLNSNWFSSAKLTAVYGKHKAA